MARIIIFGASGGCCGGPWCQRKWRGTNPCATFVPPLCWSYWHRRTWYVTSASLPWLNRVDEDGNKEPQDDSMVGMKKILNVISSQWQGHFPLDQDTQNPAQPGREHFEGWGALQGTLVSFGSLDILGFHAEDIPQMSRTPRPWAGQLWLLPSHALPLCPAVVAHCCCHWSLYRDSRSDLLATAAAPECPSQPLLSCESPSVLPTLLLWLAVTNLAVLGPAGTGRSRAPAPQIQAASLL